jgi:hypothetical protein
MVAVSAVMMLSPLFGDAVDDERIEGARLRRCVDRHKNTDSGDVL